ncbi:MAG: hypothetical protein HN742_35215 [Lentisphaerae bacterium]|jgi:hypothetical protein|nr:hypothetical protein [Lentisphaerota bacterium]MBT5605620.1 hypothetical protein [Lentisphaerota bacterium]MBT7053794.1 hypothetical protein [Lentisphaerota bacterium]MBT7847173.1 hypothetical protein [Lentisphaerota bacterium]
MKRPNGCSLSQTAAAFLPRLAICVAMCLNGALYAGPVGESVVAGSATFQRDGLSTHITASGSLL